MIMKKGTEKVLLIISTIAALIGVSENVTILTSLGALLVLIPIAILFIKYGRGNEKNSINK